MRLICLGNFLWAIPKQQPGHTHRATPSAFLPQPALQASSFRSYILKGEKVKDTTIGHFLCARYYRRCAYVGYFNLCGQAKEEKEAGGKLNSLQLLSMMKFHPGTFNSESSSQVQMSSYHSSSLSETLRGLPLPSASRCCGEARSASCNITTSWPLHMQLLPGMPLPAPYFLSYFYSARSYLSSVTISLYCLPRHG